MLMFDYTIDNVMPMLFEAGASQSFPFPGTLRQRGRVVEKEIEIAELEYEIVIRDVVAELKREAYELAYLDEAIELTRLNQTILAEMLGYAQSRYAGGSAGLNDVYRAETQLAQLEYDLITLRELRVVQLAVLNSLLNRPPEADIRLDFPAIDDAPFTLETIETLALEQSHEARLAALGVDKADEGIRLARMNNLPKFTVGARYVGMERDMLMPGDPRQSVMVGGAISLPIWTQKNSARVRYAQQDRAAAENRSDSTLNRIRVNVRKAVFELENARRLVELYRDHLLPQAERSIEIAQEWNREGEGAVSEPLEAQSVWFNFQLAAARARSDYAQAWANVERIVGGSLKPIIEASLDDKREDAR